MDLTKLAEYAGLATGVAVTAALRLSSKWDAPILENGAPVERIPGAERIGDRDLRQRHQEVVGPLISLQATQMAPGVLQTLVASFGAGATEAPGATYRLEAKLADQLKALGVPIKL